MYNYEHIKKGEHYNEFAVNLNSKWCCYCNTSVNTIILLIVVAIPCTRMLLMDMSSVPDHSSEVHYLVVLKTKSQHISGLFP